MARENLLAYITGSVDDNLLLRNDHLATEDRVPRAQTRDRLKLTDSERKTLAQIGKGLGKKLFDKVATIGKPDTYRLCGAYAARRWTPELFLTQSYKESGDFPSPELSFRWLRCGIGRFRRVAPVRRVH